MKRRERHLGRPRRVGIVVLAFIMLLPVLIFGGVPFIGQSFQLDVVVQSANQVRAGSPVRLGGVDVGRVDEVKDGPGANAGLELSIDDDVAARVRTDASASVLPRLLLEGSAYIDLSPGTPEAPRMRDGATIPLERSHVAVQLDEVLGVFDRPTRDALKSSVAELSTGLGSGRSGSGRRGLRAAARELDASLTNIRQVAKSLQGTAPNDLSRALASTGAMTEQLALDPAALSDIVTNYDRVFAALSDNAQALGESIDGLDQLLRSAPPRLASIDRALEPTRRFARGLDLALARLPDVIGVARPALRELTGLVGPEELPALLRDLRPAVETLPPLTARLTDAFNRLTPVSRCFSRNIIPTLNTEVPDGPLSTGRPVWQDLLHFGAALASFSNTFDGNGIALRLGTQFSEVGLTAQLPGGGKLYGAGDIVGRAPVALNKAEDLQMRPDAPCTEQDLPKLGNRREIGLPAGIERYRRAPSGTAGRALLAALGARDKRGVLDALQRLVPGAKHPTRPARTPARPRRPRPGGRRPVAPTPAPVPAMPEPTVTPKPLLPPLDLDGVNESVNQVLDAVGELLSPRPGSAGTPGRPLDLLKGLSP